MKRLSRPRKTANLSEALNQHLKMYVLAASAAGLGGLAVAQPAEGKIIYTPAHHVIPERATFQLDLNHDKNIDFTLSNRVSCRSSGCLYSLAMNPAKGNAGIGHHSKSSFFPVASALKRGARVGPHAPFSQGFEDLAVGYNACSFDWCTLWGPWVNVRNRYLGLKFKIKGKTHYGWARLNVHVTTYHIAAVLTGYAYETIPGNPIIAGMTNVPDAVAESATLGLLALGRK